MSGNYRDPGPGRRTLPPEQHTNITLLPGGRALCWMTCEHDRPARPEEPRRVRGATPEIILRRED